MISWLMGHFSGEVYRRNNVSGWREHEKTWGILDEETRNPRIGQIRDCYIWNAEDVPVRDVLPGVASGDWNVLNGPSARVDTILVLRDPYNWLASRIGLFGWADVGIGLMELWKGYAREFLAETGHLPVERLHRVSYNAWFGSEAERSRLALELGLPFTDRGLSRMIVGSSFDGARPDPRMMKVNDRWRVFAGDARYRDLVLADPEVTRLAGRIYGDQAREIIRSLDAG